MKVIAINGSPKKNGNTNHALETLGAVLQKQNIDFEVLHIGNQNIRGCVACGTCAKNKDEKCSMDNDVVNASIQKMKEADGIVLGAPVYFSGMPGTMKSFLDRAFYVASANGAIFRQKIGAAVVAVRRTGGSTTLDSLNHYLTFSQMPLATSNYWTVIHGAASGEASQDPEGNQAMEVLAENMAWLLKMREQTAGSVTPPDAVQKVKTNFIR